jgi:ATP-dependent Clp protease protease subunit
MQLVKCPVHTVSVGLSASMGSIILAGGEAGHRYALPHTEIMIHQPLG